MKTKAEYKPDDIPVSAAFKAVGRAQRCVTVARRVVSSRSASRTERALSCGRARSTWPVRVSAVLHVHAVDQSDPVVFKDLVDDAVVAASCRPETLEFTDQRLAEPTRSVSDRTEDGLQCGVSHLLREPVEMTETLSRDLDFIHSAASDVVLETQPLALLSVSARTPKRLHEPIVSEDVKGLFEGLEIVGAYQDKRGSPIASYQDAVVLTFHPVGQFR